MPVALVDTRMELETPENVLLTFDLAGPGSRMGAYLLDFILRYAVFYFALFLASLLMPVFGEMPFGVLLVTVFLLEWGYAALFEGIWRGQTPGKRVFKLRVIKDAGHPITIYDAVLRNFLRAADILPFSYGVGLVTMCCTKKLQRIGDLVAGTIVIHDEAHAYRRDVTMFAHLEPIPANVCTGRFHVSERTLDVIEQLLRRNKRLSRRRVEEIAMLLGEPLARQLGYPLLQTVPGAYTNFLLRVLRTFGLKEGARRG